MAKIKFKTDESGNFVARDTFEVDKLSLSAVKGNEVKTFVKLLSPKSASLKVLSLTINKKTYNIKVPKGELVSTKRFPMQVGDNKISFDGTSDTPETDHEIEVTPQFLE